MRKASNTPFVPFPNAPGWKGDATTCCMWGCKRLAEFTDSQDMGSRPSVIVYYCVSHTPEGARRWRTL